MDEKHFISQDLRQDVDMPVRQWLDHRHELVYSQMATLFPSVY